MGGISTAGTRDEGRTGAVELTGRLVCGDLDEAAAVRRHLPEHVDLTRAEPGCLRFEVEPTEDPLVWTVSELFVDRAAFEAHQARIRSSPWSEATSGVARDYVVETVGDDAVIPCFRPTAHWLEDWPFEECTLVRARATVTGPAADRAVEDFLAPLTQVRDDSVADGVRVHYWGGFGAETARRADEDGWDILLESSGQDGFSSLQIAADDLAETLRSTPGDVRLAWRELPATRADREGRDDC
ncbi:putative quinol monooxygenase [Brachybacterium paraconglomeratum]|uniref:putative quinol monooxygenase n=1 Tax=Brachybacterium paraconglomeratum TaxID=173362 RepID=UPI003FD4309E